MSLYKFIVWPHLEYYAQFWSPYLKKDIVVLENMQNSYQNCQVTRSASLLGTAAMFGDGFYLGQGEIIKGERLFI